MAKRFGRNQKRRMRQELESAQAEIRDLGLSERKAWRQVDSMRCQFQHVSDVVGTHFVGLEAKNQILNKMPEDVYRIVKQVSIGRFSPGQPTRDSIQAISYVLSVLKDTIFMDEIQQMVHVEFEMNGVCVAYGLSFEAINSAPVSVLADDLADAMSRMLAENLKHHARKVLNRGNYHAE